MIYEYAKMLSVLKRLNSIGYDFVLTDDLVFEDPVIDHKWKDIVELMLWWGEEGNRQ